MSTSTQHYQQYFLAFQEIEIWKSQRLLTLFVKEAAALFCAWIELLCTHSHFAGRANRALGVQRARSKCRGGRRLPQAERRWAWAPTEVSNLSDTHSAATCRPDSERVCSVRAHTKCSAKVGDRLAACSSPSSRRFGCIWRMRRSTPTAPPPSPSARVQHARIFATFPWRPRRFVPAIWEEEDDMRGCVFVCVCRSCLPIHNESVMQAERVAFLLSSMSLVSDADGDSST
jgi:hypothetical protein